MKTSLFQTLAALPYFQQHGLKMNYKKGQAIVRFEDTAQGIYYLDKGQAYIYIIRDDGSEQIVAFFEEGTVFGKAGSLLPQLFTPLHCQAMNDCLVYRIPCEEFSSLLSTNKEVLVSYMRQVSYNNIFFINHIIHLGEKNIYRRLIATLLLLSNYYGEQIDDSSILRMSLTQEQLASLLCITRESLSKTLKIAKQKGIIVVDHGYIRIPKLSVLKKEIDK